jgi:hypothetical protein
MRFSEESAFVAQFFFRVGAVGLRSERSPWYQLMLLFYKIPHMQFPSFVYFVFVSNEVRKGPYNAVFASPKMVIEK